MKMIRNIFFVLPAVILFLLISTPSHSGVNEWTAVGPLGGRISAMAIDSLTPSTLYAGTDAGIFKSRDGGASWRAANSGLTNLTIQSLAVDPQAPSILYAGTNDGIFKSTDGGASWTAVNTGLANASVLALAIDSLVGSRQILVENLRRH